MGLIPMEHEVEGFAIETFTTNSAGQIVFPSNRRVIAANVIISGGSYITIIGASVEGVSWTRFYLDSNSTPPVWIQLSPNTTYTVRYTYA